LTRSYYSNDVGKFLKYENDLILAKLTRNHAFALEEQQRNAWLKEIEISKRELRVFATGYLLLEYVIPRMGKRVDAVLILNGLILVMEFKINEKQYRNYDLDQCFDYALDLKYFHEQSYNQKIIPLLIATDAVDFSNTFERYDDDVFKPVKCNEYTLGKTILKLSQQYGGKNLDPIKWENSIYKPTPTIIEAAQALYQGHSVKEISRSDSGAENLVKTAYVINKIIDRSKKEKSKSICFITGVPGSGKTLAGLNLANERHKFSEEEHAVFLSGNDPLVKVLQEALARNKVENSLGAVKKNAALRETKAFIQNIHNFRDVALDDQRAPNEKVVVFDEAQRSWNQEQTSLFMRKKRGIDNFLQSEPEFLMSVMDRHKDWSVIVCLIGDGQEINRGEAGLKEWLYATKKKFRHWRVYVPTEVIDIEHSITGFDFQTIFREISHEYNSHLHLKTSIRSFRSENVAKFVNALLEFKKDEATGLLSELQEKYPIVITRNLSRAKEWLRERARANERFGLVASSKALRLKPYGIFVEVQIDPCVWFLNPKNDIRSSYFLENVATEFHIQGLELDWVCIAWDADFRISSREWSYYQFRGTDWQKIQDELNRVYLKNAYRVLLTRARQGFVIFIPEGDDNDATRKSLFYDETYRYLKELGLDELQ
jgi:hypothetical protein